MKISDYRGSVKDSSMKALCFFMFEEEKDVLQSAGQEIGSILGRALSKAEFKGKKGKIFKLPSLEDMEKVTYVMGLGERRKSSSESFRSASGDLARELKKDRVPSALLILPQEPDARVSSAVAEGFELGSYSFTRYMKEKEGEPFAEIEAIQVLDGHAEGLEKGKIMACSQNLARDLANEPGNVIDPPGLAQKASELSQEMGFECEIWDEKRIQNERMLALWHVGKGSSSPPRFIHLSYMPTGEKKGKIVLVGKGITFDSGGLNIKPGEHMRNMKGDKTGACVVLGVMRGVAKLKLPLEVHALIGAAENMPGGSSYRPDDIIRARNGKTIEVDNTDAEGRVTLADSLSIASEMSPDMIIDFATLTGACVIALGNYTAGLFSPDDKAAADIVNASGVAGERFWRLPMDDEKLREQIKSSYADVLNTGGRGGGAITAAMFLQEFVKEGIPWVHLDIAGVDHYKKPFWYYPEGATGFGVRTCLQYLLDLSE